MDEESATNDPSGDSATIFVAEGIVCERLGLSIDEAIVALADLAVARGTGLLEMARDIVAGEIDPGSAAEARRPVEGQAADPASGAA
jgi:hypothetical protein